MTYKSIDDIVRDGHRAAPMTTIKVRCCSGCVLCIGNSRLKGWVCLHPEAPSENAMVQPFVDRMPWCPLGSHPVTVQLEDAGSTGDADTTGTSTR